MCFFWYYLRVRQRLQRLKPLPHRCQTPAARRTLVEQCVRAIRPAPGSSAKEVSPYLRAAIEGWFFGAPLEVITRTDFAKWCAWAFFNQELESLSTAHTAELNQLLDWFQKEVHWTFPGQISDETREKFEYKHTLPPRSIRLSLDPVLDTQRPLVCYAVIWTINAFGIAAVRALGFERRFSGGGPGVASLSVMYRPPTLASGEACFEITDAHIPLHTSVSRALLLLLFSVHEIYTFLSELGMQCTFACMRIVYFLV